MKYKKAFTPFALAILIATGSFDARAQTGESKLEVTPLFSTINLQAFDSRESGAGVRLAYNINKHLAVEAEGTLFEFSIGDHPTDDFLAAMGLVGIKSGYRNSQFGLFAKIRPGVANFPKLKIHRGFCIGREPCDGRGRSGNRFALDAGAVIELYPTENMIVRIDAGDSMIRFSDDIISTFPTLTRLNGLSHNLQVSAGIGFRF
jgi:hypothetical protein